MSSNSLLQQLAARNSRFCDPGFKLIIAFDFYDGAECGLAIFPDGQGVRFRSLGDSRSRTLRAFELAAIKGSWWPVACSALEAAGVNEPTRFWLPSVESAQLTALIKQSGDAVATGYFVGAGDPYLERLSIAVATADELRRLRDTGEILSAYDAAHEHIKGKRS